MSYQHFLETYEQPVKIIFFVIQQNANFMHILLTSAKLINSFVYNAFWLSKSGGITVEKCVENFSPSFSTDICIYG